MGSKMRERIEVPAVNDRDLTEILDHHGLTEKLKAGSLKCESCSRAITWENLGALWARRGAVSLVCDLSECIEFATKPSE
jgi:hypothetical protein